MFHAVVLNLMKSNEEVLNFRCRRVGIRIESEFCNFIF